MTKKVALFIIFIAPFFFEGCTGSFWLLGNEIEVRSTIAGLGPYHRVIDFTNNTKYPLEIRCAAFNVTIPPMEHETVIVATGWANTYSYHRINFTITIKKPRNPYSFIYTYEYNTSWGSKVSALVVYEDDGYFRWEWRD